MGLVDFILMLNATTIQDAVPPGTSGWDDDQQWDDTEEWLDD